MAVLESEVDQHVTQLAAQLGPKAHSWLRSSLRGKRYSDLPSKLQRERVRESSRESFVHALALLNCLQSLQIFVDRLRTCVTKRCWVF